MIQRLAEVVVKIREAVGAADLTRRERSSNGLTGAGPRDATREPEPDRSIPVRSEARIGITLRRGFPFRGNAGHLARLLDEDFAGRFRA